MTLAVVCRFRFREGRELEELPGFRVRAETDSDFWTFLAALIFVVLGRVLVWSFLRAGRFFPAALAILVFARVLVGRVAVRRAGAAFFLFLPGNTRFMRNVS